MKIRQKLKAIKFVSALEILGKFSASAHPPIFLKTLCCHVPLAYVWIFLFAVFHRFTRMSPERFEHLLTLVGPHIAKKPCRSRNPISPSERLILTIRYLATGDSQQSQSFSFRIGRGTISKLIRETCDGIWEALSKTYLSPPNSTEEWIRIGKEFEEEWNFPNCLGAVDGKHIMIECPHNAGSATFHYKNYHSLVLLGICDAKYCFTFVDIGSLGGENDASILSNSNIGKTFEDLPTVLGIPCATNHGRKSLPYVLIGDDIFPLKPWLLKPYPGKNLQEPLRVYNYRLSRARRCIENTFGILAAKWRIFRRPIKANEDLVDKITKACVCLHNYLRLTDNAGYIPAGFTDSEDCTGNFIPGTWRSITQNDQNGMVKCHRISGNRYTNNAAITRDSVKDYFNSADGAISWQLHHVRDCGLIHA